MPREKDSRLTEDQLIAAELLVYGATNKEVADQLDVCEKTIMRWKKRPEFMEELDRQYEVAKNKVDNRIMKFSNQLLQNILDLSRSAKSEKVRLDASIYLLNKIGRLALQFQKWKLKQLLLLKLKKKIIMNLLGMTLMIQML